jgi:hypothetical protein
MIHLSTGSTRENEIYWHRFIIGGCHFHSFGV